MRFMNCSLNSNEANIVPFSYEKQIYYWTARTIGIHPQALLQVEIPSRRGLLQTSGILGLRPSQRNPLPFDNNCHLWFSLTPQLGLCGVGTENTSMTTTVTATAAVSMTVEVGIENTTVTATVSTTAAVSTTGKVPIFTALYFSLIFLRLCSTYFFKLNPQQYAIILVESNKICQLSFWIFDDYQHHHWKGMHPKNFENWGYFHGPLYFPLTKWYAIILVESNKICRLSFWVSDDY